MSPANVGSAGPEALGISGSEADLEALREAVARHAKLLLLAEKLPDHIATAAERVDEAYRALGIDPRKGARTRPAGAARAGGLRERILTAVGECEDGATSAVLAEQLGEPGPRLSPALAGLVNRGLLRTTPGPNGTSRGQTYHLTFPPDTEGA